ncbi:MAG: hypothetical protein LBB26_00095 [Puniceicoccales bacterium]|jgi:hypothetical protein|nr:hypothetical protein [Puniceicoccales bacterium]
MKNIADTAAYATDIVNGDWKLQKFPVPQLPPGFKLKPSFLRELPASLGRASPLPAAKTIWGISTLNKK